MGMGVVAGNLAFLEDDKCAQPEVTCFVFVFTIVVQREISCKDKLCMVRVI